MLYLCVINNIFAPWCNLFLSLYILPLIQTDKYHDCCANWVLKKILLSLDLWGRWVFEKNSQTLLDLLRRMDISWQVKIFFGEKKRPFFGKCVTSRSSQKRINGTVVLRHLLKKINKLIFFLKLDKFITTELYHLSFLYYDVPPLPHLPSSGGQQVFWISVIRFKRIF